MAIYQSLTHLNVGDTASVINLLASDPIRRRFQDLGIIEGTTIQCLQKSPHGDPIAYLIRGAVIAIRNEDASTILVSSL